MKNYVLGFCFGPDLRQVILIEKQRPSWQKGLLNGLGGGIKNGEEPIDAMCREFKEECGINIPEDMWEEFCIFGPDPANEMTGPEAFTVTCFVAAIPDLTIARKQDEEDEEIFVIAVREIAEPLSSFKPVPNLRWLIPMGINFLRGHEHDSKPFEITAYNK